MFDDWLAQVPQDSQLVVLPEMFSTGFTMAASEQAETMDGPTVAWLRAAARRLGKHICGSVVIAAAGKYRNRLLWCDPTGALRYYDKRHRFRMAGEHEQFAAGDERVVVQIGATRILLQVCYDLRFPVFARNLNDYDIYLIVANWPAARQAHWHALLAARAIENQCFVAAVNCVGEDGNGVVYAGGSALYNFQGQSLALSAGSETQKQTQAMSGAREAVFSAALNLDELHSYRSTFPAWQDADAFRII
jgi:predicted amidohydrolase